MTSETPIQPMDNEDFDALDAILDDLRTRGEDVPQWEFCEGAMAALLCTRRLVLPDEFLPLLLGTGDSQPGVASGEEGDTWFADEAQYAQFMTLWTRRWNEVASALGANVETLEDERSYHPEVMDVRGAVAMLPERLVRGNTALQVTEPPVQVPGYEMVMLWHERSHRDPAHRWLRNCVREVCL